MTMDEVMNLMRDLAQSQGFYGRAYDTFMEIRENDPDSFQALTEALESLNFKTPVDFILWFES